MATRGVMVALLLAAVAASCATAQLQEKFYSESCPSVEEVVRKEMVRALSLAPSIAAPLLRMHFHDCFVRVRLPSLSRCALSFCVCAGS
jgi:peroxidase